MKARKPKTLLLCTLFLYTLLPYPLNATPTKIFHTATGKQVPIPTQIIIDSNRLKTLNPNTPFLTSHPSIKWTQSTNTPKTITIPLTQEINLTPYTHLSLPIISQSDPTSVTIILKNTNKTILNTLSTTQKTIENPNEIPLTIPKSESPTINTIQVQLPTTLSQKTFTISYIEAKNSHIPTLQSSNLQNNPVPTHNTNPASNTQNPSNDSTPPQITAVLIDQKTPKTNDTLSKTPKITATLSDPDSGISHWTVAIKNTLTQENTVEETHYYQTPPSETTITLNISTPLPQASYTIHITATDQAQNNSTLKSPTLNIQSHTLLSAVKNSPNPFNPKTSNNHIEYQLSEAADIDLYIYAISGEKIAHTRIDAGDINSASPGYNSIVWNGKNSRNKTVANGVYIATIIARTDTQTSKKKTKIMVLK